MVVFQYKGCHGGKDDQQQRCPHDEARVEADYPCAVGVRFAVEHPQEKIDGPSLDKRIRIENNSKAESAKNKQQRQNHLHFVVEAKCRLIKPTRGRGETRIAKCGNCMKNREEHTVSVSSKISGLGTEKNKDGTHHLEKKGDENNLEQSIDN